jgi:MFS family permease
MALAAVSSIGFFGFLIGPPMIGIVAGLSSLRISFLIIAVIGIIVVLIADDSLFKRIRVKFQRKKQEVYN